MPTTKGHGKMKILLIPSPPFERIGGVSTHAHMLAGALRARNQWVRVIPERPPKIYRAPFVSLPGLLLGRISKYLSLRWTTAARHFYYILAGAFRSGFRPDVVNVQNVLHFRMARHLQMLTGCRIVVSLHGFLTFEAEQSGLCVRGDKVWKWLRDLEEEGYAGADHITAGSHSLAEYVEEFKHAPMTVIPYGIDTEMFRPLGDKEKQGLPEGRLHLLFAGVLEAHKGLFDAIEALSLLIDSGIPADLSVAGGGAELEAARAMASELGIGEHVHWRGILGKSEMPAFYGQGDVFVIPSIPRPTGGAEVGPYTAREAMSCGIPVVAYATGGIPELVEAGVTGFLVPIGDRRALAAAIAKLADTELRKQMGENARRRVVELFSADTVAGEYIQVYEQAVSHGRHTGRT